jgi:hypothetical protein
LHSYLNPVPANTQVDQTESAYPLRNSVNFAGKFKQTAHHQILTKL